MRTPIIALFSLLVILLGTAPVYAECKNEPAWLKTFPQNWELKSEYRIGELTVRTYRSPENWLGIYYRTDYPALIKEGLITEAPAKTDFSSGMPHITFGERHYLMRLVIPGLESYEPEPDSYRCWREVYGFYVEVEAKVIKPGVRFTIVEIKKEQ